MKTAKRNTYGVMTTFWFGTVIFLSVLNSCAPSPSKGKAGDKSTKGTPVAVALPNTSDAISQQSNSESSQPGSIAVGSNSQLPTIFSSSPSSSQVAIPTDAVSPHFVAGFSRGDVSPPLNTILGGYGTYTLLTSPRKNTEGTHDPLEVNVMALSRGTGKVFALVALDAVGISSETVRRVKDYVGANLKNPGISFVISASHTHHSPDTLGLWGQLPASGRDNNYMNFLEKTVGEKIIEAVGKMEPVHIYSGTGTKSNTTSQATDPLSKDDSFTVLMFQNVSGKMMGTLTQWAAHPTVLGEENHAASADFVGAYRYFLTKTNFGTGVNLYINGALGNIYPQLDGQPVPDPFSGPKDPKVKGGYEKMAGIGKELATKVVTSLSSAQLVSIENFEYCRREVLVPLSNLRFSTASSLGAVEKKIQNSSLISEISVLKFGGFAVGFIPGEAFPSIAHQIRGLVSEQGKFTGIVAGMANDWLGYMLSKAEYDIAELSYFRDLAAHKDAGIVIVDAMQKTVAKQGTECW